MSNTEERPHRVCVRTEDRIVGQNRHYWISATIFLSIPRFFIAHPVQKIRTIKMEKWRVVFVCCTVHDLFYQTEEWKNWAGILLPYSKEKHTKSVQWWLKRNQKHLCGLSVLLSWKRLEFNDGTKLHYFLLNKTIKLYYLSLQKTKRERGYTFQNLSYCPSFVDLSLFYLIIYLFCCFLLFLCIYNRTVLAHALYLIRYVISW